MEQGVGGEIKTSLLDNSHYTQYGLEIYMGQEGIMEQLEKCAILTLSKAYFYVCH